MLITYIFDKVLKKQISIIGSVGIPAKYGGFETFAQQISIRLNQHFPVTVFCSKYRYTKNERGNKYLGVSRKFVPIKPNGPLSILYDIISIIWAYKSSSVLLVLGTGVGFFIRLFKLMAPSKKFIVHVDGIEWKRQKWSNFTKSFLKKSYHAAIKNADIIILDNHHLKEMVPLELRKKSIIIGYGGNHVFNVKKQKSIDSKYALAIARAEPENNLDIILATFAMSGQSLKLKVFSNWKSTRHGQLLYNKYSAYNNISLIDATYDLTLLQKYRNHCLVYIHGHSAGGTNPSLVEAMYSGVPVIAHDNPFNRHTTNNSALYFKCSAELTYYLNNTSLLDLKNNAKKMKEYALEHYNWDSIVKELLNYI